MIIQKMYIYHILSLAFCYQEIIEMPTPNVGGGDTYRPDFWD